MSSKTIELVGFGSQGSAWAQCLKQSGWNVRVYFARQKESYHQAIDLGFSVHSLSQLPQNLQNSTEPAWIAMLCPDSAIAPIYLEYLSHLEQELRLILAHGFAIFTGELKMKRPEHQAALLAPKAIGPKILENFESAFPHPHSLSAAFFLPSESTPQSKIDLQFLQSIAQGLGFHEKSLIPATFDQETRGDLMSEQGLLCGGIFNLLEWTLESMMEAGIPEALIYEECITELELVASILRKRGPSKAFNTISQAAQCGTIAMQRRLARSGFKKEFKAQMESIQNHEFSKFFHSQEWRSDAQGLSERLLAAENKLKANSGEIKKP